MAVLGDAIDRRLINQGQAPVDIPFSESPVGLKLGIGEGPDFSNLFSGAEGDASLNDALVSLSYLLELQQNPPQAPAPGAVGGGGSVRALPFGGAQAPLRPVNTAPNLGQLLAGRR